MNIKSLNVNLQPYRNTLVETCNKEYICKLYFFGSVCTSKFTEDSDIDLLVELEPMQAVAQGEILLELWNDFEQLFDRKVDLITTDQNIRNPILRKNIENTKQLFYDRARTKTPI